jgi:hypothetical protein
MILHLQFQILDKKLLLGVFQLALTRLQVPLQLKNLLLTEF